MTILRVRKTRIAEAVQINTPEDEKTVQAWLTEWDGESEHDLTKLKKAGVYFMRDEGSPIVYITPAADFLSFFEEVDDVQDLGFQF